MFPNKGLGVAVVKKKFRLQHSKEERIEATTRRKRRRIREDNDQVSKFFALRRANKRAKMLAEQRSEASLANALKHYREHRNYTRTELADMLGITRRALFNYETGARAVPGEVLETLVKRGDAELHQLFAVPYEPAPEEQRVRDAQLAIDLFAECRNVLPEADVSDLRRVAAEAAATWQTNLKPTRKNVRSVAIRLTDTIKDLYAQEWLEPKQSDDKDT